MTSIRHDAFRNGTRTMVQAFAIERTSGKEKKEQWQDRHMVLTCGVFCSIFTNACCFWDICFRPLRMMGFVSEAQCL